MGTLQDSMTDFRKQLQKGSIQQAYRGLMEYMMGLRTRFAKDYPQYDVSGGLYPGYMDMTYFSIFPPALKARKLKIALVFRYDHFSFEVWLSGANRGALAEYRQWFVARGWDKYRLVDEAENPDAVLEHMLAADPDFDDPEALTAQIEQGVVGFIEDVEKEITKEAGNQ